MSNWKLIVPEGGTNLMDNPSFETGTTGWSASGTNTIAQDATQQRFGVYSLAMTYQDNTTLATYSGITLTAAAHTFSAWVYLSSNWDGGVVRLAIANFASATTDTATTTTDTTGEWVRLQMTFTPDGGDLTGDVIIETASAPTAGRIVYADAVQVEAQSYSTTYIDGAQEDCSWDGADHASSSTRVAYGIGGRIRDFEDDLSFPSLEMQDIGVPPVALHFNEQAPLNRNTLSAVMYQRRRMAFRTSIRGSSLSNMHSLRQTLIKALNPLTGRANDPPRLRRLRYTGASEDKEIDITYDDGLRLQDKEGFTDEAGVTVIAPDPNFYQIGEAGATLDVADTITMRVVAGRQDGGWSALGPPHASGTYNDVRAIVADEENGYIYFGGDFVNFNNVANADGIVRYDVAAGTYAALGTGTSGAGNDTVNDMALAPNGDLYVTGDFLNMGGVAAADYIARWDGSSWNALGTGLNALGRAIDIATDGRVWVGGDFTTANSVTVNHITYWNGTTFVAIDGGPGLDDDVHAVHLVPTAGGELVLVGGKFRAENGGTPGDLERFNVITSAHGTPTFAATPPSAGFNNTVNVIQRIASGRVWIGGAFTADSDGNTLSKLGEWTGTGQATEVGGGTGTVNDIYPAPDGTIWIIGNITTAGSGKSLFQQLNGLVKRVGDAWVPPRIDLNAGGTTNIGYAVTGYGDDIYIGIDYSGTTEIAGSTDITYTGTAPAYPVITVNRSGGDNAYLYEIINRTTGATLSFRSYDIKDGEAIIIDTRPGSRSVHNNKGTSLVNFLSSPEGLGSFYLAPANSGNRTNTIDILVKGVTSPTMTATIRYRVAFISAD